MRQNPLHGNSVEYILGRLERDGRHDLIGAIRAGSLTAYAAAASLGWTTRPENIGTGSSNAARRRERQIKTIAGGGFDLQQMQELWLGGDRSRGSVFGSREELRASWEKHRAECMRLWGSRGRRPMGWWEFDAGDLKHPGYFRERSFLWRAIGILSESERIELEREWRAEFDAARGMGARERREHYEHCDIPHELITAWTAERRRRGRQRAPSEEVAAAK
jgi:hypothetical protein